MSHTTRTGIELMNRWNRGLANPAEMAVMGHSAGPSAYAFILQHNGREYEITITGSPGGQEMSHTHDEHVLGFDAASTVHTNASPPAWTRVYRKGGRVAHFKETALSTHPDIPEDVEWYGTGSQREYDHAAGMPLCRACFARREAGGLDSRLGEGHGEEMT